LNLLSSILSFALVSRSVAEEPPSSAITRSLRCAAAIDALVSEWRATGEILRAPGSGDGRDVFRLATDERGVFIVLQLHSDSKEATLGRASASGATWVSFDEECRASRRDASPTGESLPPGGYDDSELAADLAENDGVLVVFLWSPHMPISVDAYFEIADACRALSLPLRAVTDPSSDPGYVLRVASSREIPAEARAPLASAELLFRDLAVHAPSVLVFSPNGVTAPLPGFRDRKAYRAFLEKAISAK
jgi:hypothetical protein